MAIQPKKKRRPLLLPKENYPSIVVAGAKGISLKEFGGSIELSKLWAFSFLLRHGYVKGKGTCISHARGRPEQAKEHPIEFYILLLNYNSYKIQKLLMIQELKSRHDFSCFCDNY